jgi:uncharacterized damage-inducible protein DinB
LEIEKLKGSTMTVSTLSLKTVFDGWDGYNTSILHAVAPLTREQLAWRPAPNLRSTGEIASHIAFGRVVWFSRMPAPGSEDLFNQAQALGWEGAIAEDGPQIVKWLEASWHMIADTLNQWTTDDLKRKYRHEYQGQVYLVSYQWTIWRILTHDVHHGGELALVLGQQGIALPELGDLFGHLTTPPLAE